MFASGRVRFWSTALISIVSLALHGTTVQTQQRGGTERTDKEERRQGVPGDQVPPVNSGANPYRVIRDWAQLNLEGRP